ncbi:MAG TPA: hypothetical protein VE056_10340 [Pyrinomonadaceae bacterium]|nr:hypothetical protein [Pyrinomonadaceae bacterium]
MTKASNVGSSNTHRKLGVKYFVLVWPLFFAICFGLGYPSLSRYDPRQVEGLSDAANYYQLATGEDASTMREVFRCRILVPYVARPFYLLANNHLRTWNAGFFALLLASSLFCATTACFVVAIGVKLSGDMTAALLGATLYLLNFSVSNLQLSGMIDAGEACFIAAMIWSLLTGRWYLLLLWGLLGALAKETFVPLSTMIALSWWLKEWRQRKVRAGAFLWVVSLGIVGIAAVIAVHSIIYGQLRWPWNFVVPGNAGFLRALWRCISERNFWYVFGWLIPFGVWRLRYFPRAMVIASVAAAVTAIFLGAVIDAGGSIGRSVFNVTGPLLSLSVASLISARTNRNQPGAIPADNLELP